MNILDVTGADTQGIPVSFDLIRTTFGSATVTCYFDGAIRNLAANERLVVDSYVITTDTRQTIWLYVDADDDNAPGPGERIGGGINIGQDGVVQESGIRHVCKAGYVPKLYTGASAHNTSVIGHGRIIRD
jgi:hypothetical protein